MFKLIFTTVFILIAILATVSFSTPGLKHQHDPRYSYGCSIVPDEDFEHLINNPDADPEARVAAQRSLEVSQRQRAQRIAIEDALRNPPGDASQTQPQGPPDSDHGPGPSTGGSPNIGGAPNVGGSPPAPGTGGTPDVGSTAPESGSGERQVVFAMDSMDSGSGDQGFAAEGAALNEPTSKSVPHLVPGPYGSIRMMYDLQNTDEKPGTYVRNEVGPESTDRSIIQAFEHLGITYRFYKEVFNQSSLDFKGQPLLGCVHLNKSLSNAIWDGITMSFGDGDGIYTTDFTTALDVVGHELTHGVIQHSANLLYKDQSGALNEHLADAFGIMIKQWHLNQDVHQANWLVGEGLYTDKIKGRGQDPPALRTMKAPADGARDPKSAYGPGWQPDRMSNIATGTQDKGRVHTNSGIPNKAFYNAAIAMGGRSWNTVGPYWYLAMTKSNLPSNATFQVFADTLMGVAKKYGSSKIQDAIRQGWAGVEITV